MGNTGGSRCRPAIETSPHSAKTWLLKRLLEGSWEGSGVCWPETLPAMGTHSQFAKQDSFPVVQLRKFKISGQEFKTSQPTSSVRLGVWVGEVKTHIPSSPLQRLETFNFVEGDQRQMVLTPHTIEKPIMALDGTGNVWYSLKH